MRSASPFSRLVACAALVLCAAVAMRAGLGAEQGRGGAPGAPATPVVDPVPTAISSIFLSPATYIGKAVSVTTSVSRQISPTVFIVTQNRNPAQGEILVIAPALQKVPQADGYVTVIGPLVAFDPADVATRLTTYKLELPADVTEKFRGKPAILATSVVTTEFTDLTKKPAGPMTPDDVALTAIMRQVQPAAGALRTAATASDAAAVKTRVAELKKLLTDAQTVFKNRSIMTALLYSSDAIKHLDAADAAAAAGKWDEVTAANTSFTQSCTTCHNAHRERQDDGTYRLKIGG
jgi:cytochrome c556